MANALNLLQGFAAAPSSSAALTSNDQTLQADSHNGNAADSLAKPATRNSADGEFAAVLKSKESEASASKVATQDSKSGESPDPEMFFHASQPLIGDQQAYTLLPRAGNGLPLWGEHLPSAQVLSGVGGVQTAESIVLSNGGVTDAALDLSPDQSAASFEDDPIFSGLSFLPESAANRAATTAQTTKPDNPGVLDELELNRQGKIAGLDATMVKQQAANRYNSALQNDKASDEPTGHVSPLSLQRGQTGEGRLERTFGSLENSASSQTSTAGVQDSPLGLERLLRSEVAVVPNVQTSATGSALDALANAVDSNSNSTNGGAQGIAARLDSNFRESLELSANRLEQARVTVPFNQPGWSENLGKQLNLLVSRNMDAAQIQLDPPELGPMQVRIQVHNDQVTLQFTSQHATVREALEQSVARLQQMFSEEGMDLVNVNVSDQGSGSERQQAQSDTRADESGFQEGDEILTQPLTMAVEDGKIDYFI